MVLLVRTLRGKVLYHNSPDGGWAWVVLASGFFIMATVFSVARSLGIFYNDFKDAYGTTNSQTSWVLSIATAMLGLAAPAGAFLMRKFDARKVLILSGILCCIGMFVSAFGYHIWVTYLGIGIIWGIGFSWSYICILTQVNLYFKRWRGIVNGLVACGSSVGGMLMPILSQHLLSVYGWRGTMFILAGIGLNVSVFGALVRPISSIGGAGMAKYRDVEYADKATDIAEIQAMTVSLEVLDYIQKAEEQGSLGPTSKVTTFAKFFRDYWVLMLLGLAEFVMGLCMFIPIIYIVPFAKDIGCEPEQAAFLLSMTAIGDMAFRPITGAIISCFPVLEKRILFCMAAVMFAQTALCTVAIFSHGYQMLLVYAILYSCIYGSFITMMTIATPVLIGMENLEKFIGLIYFLSGISSLISPPFAGYLVDLYGSYRAAYWYAMACYFFLFTLLIAAGYGVAKLGSVLPEHRSREADRSR